MAAQYPERDSHFAHRVVRLLAKCAAAQEIGPEGTWLVTIIAHTEDATHYSRPVTYYNEQLMGVCGFSSHGRLIRTRERAVAAGWLHYQPGGKRRPATYWSTIPANLEAIPDDFASEMRSQIGNESGEEHESISILEAHPERIRSANGTPPTLSLSLKESPGFPPDGQPAKGKKTKAQAFTAEDMETAKAFWQRVVTLQPDRTPPKFEGWAETIRLMRERDHRSHAGILDLFDRVQRDSFWRVNVLSPDKLRTKWDDLSLKLRPIRRASSQDELQPLPELKGVGT